MTESDQLLARARTLRRAASDAENALWQQLRGRRLKGFKFRRQVTVEPYIVDFVCLEAKLIVEVDGGQHADQASYDERRTAVLESRGYRVMRFWNHDVLNEVHSVQERILNALLETPSPHPSPGGRGG